MLPQELAQICETRENKKVSFWDDRVNVFAWPKEKL